MDRRTFVRLLSAVPLVARGRLLEGDAPPVKVASRYRPVPGAGMPGPYPGTVVSVRSDRVARHGHPRRPTRRSSAR